MLKILEIALPQVKAINTTENLLDKIRIKSDKSYILCIEQKK